MIASSFSHVDTWVFDLDNTLYPPEAALFDQIEVKMTAFVMDALGVDRAEADQLRAQYWREHGTTLAGLMDLHSIDPGPYLHEVHDISMHPLEPAPDLAAALAALPGRRIVYTNGTAPYAQRVIEARGLSGLFDAVYGVEHANFRPKPEVQAFQTVFALDGVNPKTAAMFEDELRNLHAPFHLGMQTVHVAPSPVASDHVHHHTSDLTQFLQFLRK